MQSLNHILVSYSLSAAFGVLPPLFWLWFWLKEDSVHPEPKKRILETFIAGMIAAPLVVPLQMIANQYFSGTTVIIIWVFLEEFFILVAAYLAGLHTNDDDEPIDAVVYMITAALGFAAMENVFFILRPVVGGELLNGLILGNFRFIGASLLHLCSSSVIGIALGLSFYKSRRLRRFALLIGLGIASALHAAFNLSIIRYQDKGIYAVFFGLWVVVVLIIMIIEKVKTIHSAN